MKNSKFKIITNSISNYIDEYQILAQIILLFATSIVSGFNLSSNAILIIIVVQLLCLSVSLKKRKSVEDQLLESQKTILSQKKDYYTSEQINLNDFLKSIKKDLYCYSIFGAWTTEHKQKILQLCQNNVHIHLMVSGNLNNYKEYAEMYSPDDVVFQKLCESYEANIKKFRSDVAELQHTTNNNNNFEVRYINKIFSCSFFAKDTEQQDGIIFWREYLPATKQNKANRYHGFFIRQSDTFYSSYVKYIHELWESADKKEPE